MDKHDRPYRCSQPECFNLIGFTYWDGLLQHEREVHSKHGGPEPHPCPEPGCSNLPSFASASALSRHIRDVHSKRGGPKEILRCPIDECKRHVGKAFSRMDGLVKHLAAIHGIKKSSAEVRRDYLFPPESPNRQGSREPVGEHENVSPGPRLQEIIAPLEQFLRERQNLRDEVAQLALREQQNKARMLTVQQELDIISPQSATPLPLSARLDPHEQRDHDMRSIWEDVEPRGDTMNAEDAAAVLRRHQAQLMTLEQQNEIRVSMTQQEQDSPPPQPAIPSPSPYQLEPLPGPDYKMQLMLLEQKNKKRLLMERDDKPPEGGHPCFMEECVGLGSFGTNDLIVHLTVVHGFDEHVATNYAQSLHTANLALQDYQMQLMLLDVHKTSRRPATQEEQGSFRSEPTTTLPELHVHEYQPPADVKRVAPSIKVAIDSGPKKYAFADQTPGNLDKGKKAVASASGTAENDRIMRPDRTVHPEVMIDYNDELYNPKVTAMYAGVDTRKANAGIMRKTLLEDGEKLPGVQSIIEAPWRLQSESSLERATLGSSSNSYDKRLLTRMGGPLVSQGSGQQRQAVASFPDQGSPHRDHFSSDSIASNDREYDWDDLVRSGNFEHMSDEELNRLFPQVCCRVEHCL
jgi:hypothetical protein